LLRQVPVARLQGLETSDQGLSEAQVAERRSSFGRNTIVEETSSGWLEIFRSTIKDPMVWFLTATALLFVWLGDYTEAAILAAALVPIAGMDAYLHRRTQASTEGLSGRIASHARVLRGGSHADVPAEDLVPGDLVVVSAGSYFPADGLILMGDNLQADESTLTGEALPVRKQVINRIPSGERPAPVDGIHWGMAGTRLLTGEARVRIVQTGADTLYGEIARLSQATHAERTPLQEAIGHLVKILLMIALALCLLLAAIRYLQGAGVVDAILSAVTLAIAALPEEFPVVFSFFLGVGVYRLAKRQALVRRAVVVENIGRITCICTDKTGTLTEGKLALGDAVPAQGVNRAELLRLAAAASRAETGDPLDLLLIKATQASDRAVEAVFPFTEDRRREVVVQREALGVWRAAMKGAPETILQMANFSDEEREDWIRRTHELSASGKKLIGVASCLLPDWSGNEPQGGFDFAGLLAFTDPVRPGVAEAVKAAQAAGIRVIMITGDHEQTASAIAQEIGIGGEMPKVIDGAEMAQHLVSGASTAGIDVVARCIPSQKLDLVRALREEGELVAVTGDGVNDAPALRGADIGIAMGERGTRSAREVASIVLLDDNFSTIIRAIGEGRQLFRNLKLSFAYLLMLHAPLVATAALIPLLGYPLLYLPVHIVWLELIIHPTALLVFQQLPSSDGLETVRRDKRARFFKPHEWVSISVVGAVATGVIVWGYSFNLGDPIDVPHARSMAMAVLVTASAAITAALSGLTSRNAWIAVLVTMGSALLAIQLQPVSTLLHLSPLHLIDWLVAVGGGLLVSAGAAIVGRRPLRNISARHST